MATLCTGITVTWGGVSLGEVVDIKVARGTGLPLGRNSTYALDLGTIEVKCLSTAALGMAEYGRRRVFAVTGGGLTFTHKAVCQTFRMAGTVNDVARYEASFKLQT